MNICIYFLSLGIKSIIMQNRKYNLEDRFVDYTCKMFAVANIVGGTIVVPHTRRAAEYWEELKENVQ